MQIIDIQLISFFGLIISLLAMAIESPFPFHSWAREDWHNEQAPQINDR